MTLLWTPRAQSCRFTKIGRAPAHWLSLSFLAAVLIGAPIQPAIAETDDTNLQARDLAKLPLNELFNVEVTSVSKRPQKLSETASAIQVLTADDIRRSGATHLADVLRIAANVEVQQVVSYGWVVSTRGFDALFSNKLLVMIDGRTIYTPLDAGVIWDAQGVLLEDIDRIEIISGPGGTLWGANAVNGVINIITKSAHETRGTYISGGGGSFVKDAGEARIGGGLGAKSAFRVYGQRFDRNGMVLPDGDEGMNAWNTTRGGFRMDGDPEARTRWTLQGDAYLGRESSSPLGTSTIDGQNVLGHWSRSLGAGSAFDVQLYADRTWRRDLPGAITDQLETYDANLQHRLPLGSRQTVLWGAGYRLMVDETPPSTPIVGFVPVERHMELVSAFLQDEFTLVPERLTFTIGSKLENGAYTSWEAQPSARLTWTPTERQTIWSAVSRALRAPSRIDVDYHIPTTPPYLIAGGPDFHSEKVDAYELGYRAEPFQALAVSLAGFYNKYDDLYSVEQESPPAAFPYTIQNGAAGQTWGAEFSGVYRPAEWWRMRGGYTWIRKDLWSRPGHDVLNSVLASLGNDPNDQAVLQSMIDVSSHWRWDVTGRYVDRLPNPGIPSYIGLDSRLAWTVGRWEISTVGQNLIAPQHSEFSEAQQVPRSVFGRLAARW